VTMQPGYLGHAFDDRETRLMGDAFIMACHVVEASHAGNGDRGISAALKRDIAATVLQVASLGVMDPGTMAQAAIDRVWSEGRIRA
jgi:hypothetical protein